MNKSDGGDPVLGTTFTTQYDFEPDAISPTTSMSTTEIHELTPALQFNVERLLARYALTIDEDELERWPELFTDDCLYRLISRENVERGLPVAAIFCDSKGMLIDRVVSLRNANIYEKHRYRHTISGVLIDEVSNGVIVARSNYVVFRTRTNGVTEVYNAGIYRDKIVNVNGAYLFQEKVAVFDTHVIDSLLATPI